MLSQLPFMPSDKERLDVSMLETWLWDAACAIRGAQDAPKFKDFILPLIFYKRLSDVFDDEFAGYVEEYGDEKVAHEIIKADHEYGWQVIRNHPADGKLGEFVTEGMRKVAEMNPDLQGVLDVKDYNERQSGERALDDDRLASLIEVISRHRLGLRNTEPDIIGRAYEYLLRKFAEGQGQSAGEFYTPKEVGWLIAELINPESYSTVYDPACGSGGLLIKTRLLFESRHTNEKSKAPKVFGQELNAVTYAMAKMNAFLHDYTNASIAIGDTFKNPKFAAKGAGLTRFDYVVTNPMWNQDNYDEKFYESDTWKRFENGIPPKSSADWGWVQHILSSLKENGRAAVVLDTGAVSRGSGSKSSSKERNIRKIFVEQDIIEGVILLPDNLFYNTSAPGVILMLNRHKSIERNGQFLLVNASAYFVKEKPKNALTDEGIAAIANAFYKWETQEKLCKVVTLDQVRAADYNLSPSQFVEINGKIQYRLINEVLADLAVAKADRERADMELDAVLSKLGLDRIT